jgi:hypothetical protein
VARALTVVLLSVAVLVGGTGVLIPRLRELRSSSSLSATALPASATAALAVGAAATPVVARPVSSGLPQARRVTTEAPPTIAQATAAPTEPAWTDQVQWPDSALLDGTAVPLGAAGVQSAGGRAFARKLVQFSLTNKSGLVEAPDLDALAERALIEQLRNEGAVPSGSVQQAGALVRFHMLGALPWPPDLRLPPPTGQRIGAAAAVAKRIEPEYLPDLVVVAALAYAP